MSVVEETCKQFPDLVYRGILIDGPLYLEDYIECWGKITVEYRYSFWKHWQSDLARRKDDSIVLPKHAAIRAAAADSFESAVDVAMGYLDAAQFGEHYV